MRDVLVVPAQTANLARIGAFVRDRCPDDDRAPLVELAITELAVNAIRHGGATTLGIEVEGTPDAVRVVLQDDGAPFDPTTAETREDGELREGGYGLSLARRSATHMTHERRDGQNVVTLVFSDGGPT